MTALSVDPVLRRPFDIAKLNRFFRHNKYVRSIVRQSGSGYHSLSHFSRAIRCETFEANRNIINYGDRAASKFYILLKGRVQVQVPSTYTRRMTHAELHTFMAEQGARLYERPTLIDTPKRRMMRA